MSDNTIEKDVRELLVSHFQLDDIADGEELSPDTVHKWDSLGHMTLIEKLEKQFSVSFSQAEIVSMLSEEAIVEQLHKQLR